MSETNLANATSTRDHTVATNHTHFLPENERSDFKHVSDHVLGITLY